MGEDVLVVPAEQIELGTDGQKAEARLGQSEPILAPQPLLQRLLHGVQVENIGSRIFDLRLRQFRRAPV